jgi:general secretion pathway protein G
MKTCRSHLPGAVRAGFSLAELMVVIVILGLIATIVVPNVFSYLSKATVVTAKADINGLVQAIESYAISNMGKRPDNLEILIQPDENGNTYLSGYTEIPLDPWGNPYFYVPPSGNQPYRVGSYGKDGQPGGEGEDADIDNSTIKVRK